MTYPGIIWGGREDVCVRGDQMCAQCSATRQLVGGSERAARVSQQIVRSSAVQVRPATGESLCGRDKHADKACNLEKDLLWARRIVSE